MPGISSGIPVTARPTFSHEGDFNFTWGFYHDFDLTVLVPVVTNHFDRRGAPVAEGTGLGDAMVLAKYRFYRRDSPRGTTQASVTLGPKFRRAAPIWLTRMARACLQVCNPARVPPICFWQRTGLTPGFSTSNVWWLMRISIPSCAHRGRSKLGSAAISNHASGSRTGPTNQRMWPANGSLVQCSPGCILRTTVSPPSLREAVAATFCWPESRPTPAYDPECIFGLAWIGTSRIRAGGCLCLFGATSVLELRNSFGSTFKERRNDEHEKVGATSLFGSMVVCQCSSGN